MKEKIYGEIVALFRNLIFREPSKIIASIPILNLPLYQGEPEIFRVQFCSLWFTKNTYKHLNNIVSLLSVNNEIKLISKGIPKKEIEKLILNIISCEAFRCDYLNTDDISMMKKEDLLSCNLEKTPLALAEKFYIQIRTILLSKQTNYLVILPLMSLKSESFELGFDGIFILKSYDNEFWNIFQTKGGLDLESLTFKEMSLSLYNDISVICKSYGTEAYVKLDAEFKVKKFISILFSFLFLKDTIILNKSMYKEESRCFCINRENVNFSTYTQILPHYIKSYTINTTLKEDIIKYYERLDLKSDFLKKRVSISANYINKAMNSTNLTDKFINYYISLDALFGISGYVEKSIKLGIETITSDITLRTQSKYFYKLRNELVHGGSRFIEEWDLYEEYYSKFKSEIVKDIEYLTFLCINNFPLIIDDNSFEKNIEIIKENMEN